MADRSNRLDQTDRPTDFFGQVLAARPYLDRGAVHRTDHQITVVYTYAHGGDHRLVVESAMLGGDPPLVHVRAWLGDWARYMDTPVQESTTDDLPTLTLTGLVGDQPLVVRAIPAALPHPRANRVHPVVRRLRGMREARGWSADHTARLLGYDTNTLWRWEHGETVPRVDQLADYAQAFGLDLALTPAGGRR